MIAIGTDSSGIYISGPPERTVVSTGGTGGGLFVVVAVLLHAAKKANRVSKMAKALLNRDDFT